MSVRPVSLWTMLREWGRIGVTGFGGPPAHIRLLRQLVVERNGWLDASEFEDAVAVCNLLPGPASTQLTIFCAWRLRGTLGALVGGLAFILPGLVVILGLAVLFVESSPPTAVLGAGAGAGGAVPAVAIAAGWALVTPSWRGRRDTVRWLLYLAAGVAAAVLIGTYLVLVLLACGAAELAVRAARGEFGGTPDPGGAKAALEAERSARPEGTTRAEETTRAEGIGGADADEQGEDRGGDGGGRLHGLAAGPMVAALAPVRWLVAGGVLGSVAWVAFKVGGLSFGGGFVIIPLMQADAVNNYHWMTGAQFLNAVALGQVTPGPVVQTVAVVGYAAAGIVGGLLASAVAFAPSFAFVLLGGRYFDRIRANKRARAFLDGAGPAAIGAIFGSAVTLARELTHPWQFLILAGALALLFLLRRGVVLTLTAAAAVGVVVMLATTSG
jgi:chromate transporter